MEKNSNKLHILPMTKHLHTSLNDGSLCNAGWYFCLRHRNTAESPLISKENIKFYWPMQCDSTVQMLVGETKQNLVVVLSCTVVAWCRS